MYFRFVDEFGNHRTGELADIFRNSRIEGRRALLDSLEYIRDWVGGMETYLRRYPVPIIAARPAFPQLKIIGIENVESKIYRVLVSKAKAYLTNEPLK